VTKNNKRFRAKKREKSIEKMFWKSFLNKHDVKKNLLNPVQAHIPIDFIAN